MATAIPARLTAAEGRRFGLTVGAAFLVLAAIGLWRGHVVAPTVFATLGIPLIVAGLVVPTRLGPVFRAWMDFAHRLSRITTPILLAVIYFVVLTPTGLVMRLFGRRPMHRPVSHPSFWLPRAAA